MPRNLLIAAAVLSLAACGGSPEPEDPQKSAPSISTPNTPVSFPARVDTGVALELAEQRKASISEVHYTLSFRVPNRGASSQSIRARQTLTFQMTETSGDLQLDFREEKGNLKSVAVNGNPVQIRHEAEHLILPAASLKSGENIVDIEFIAGDTSLNRNPDYLYTLFVPDRARTAFPLFDQPNMKATYDLELDLPAGWVALANGQRLNTEASEAGRQTHTFATTDKLSSYLFSFVAGEFETITRTLNGREMTMLHRETDEEKLARNVDDIFQAHADALAWMEDYTGIAYPFQKFDFALIPTFQYGGMEHVGAIQYRASTLLLVKDPSAPQKLRRANLIAHETAHMWFGNLVTMDWFNDVWTKEVFANFMAAKIVNPSFPDVDHDLNFLLRSYPAAYAVDRTEGANPIRQDLPNLNEAGNLYGGIIYNKAPIMMDQLEGLIGEDAFRKGMQEYLTTYAGRNATWPDLIAILDAQSDQDLKAWSQVWVNTAGRPHYVFNDERTGLEQIDPAGKGRVWGQTFSALSPSIETARENWPAASSDDLLRAQPGLQIDAGILVNSNGAGYGLFPVDLALTDKVWDNLSDLQKGAQLINLFEQMLEGHDEVTPARYMQFLFDHLDEPNELILNTLLGQVRRTYWSFLSADERRAETARFDAALWALATDKSKPVSTRRLYLVSLPGLEFEQKTYERLRKLLNGESAESSLLQSERARGAFVAELAIKVPEDANDLITEHLGMLKNPDEKRRFEFLAPVLSGDEANWDVFFERLNKEEHRAIESWVVDALAYLHHPLRTASSERYLQRSLELMEEIQVTGDIFFPGRWINGSLLNHKTPSAALIVREFLAERPDYNYQLKLKILQGADMLFRASAHADKTPG